MAAAVAALPKPAAAAAQQGLGAPGAPQGPAAAEAQHREWWEAYLTPGKGRRLLLRCALLKTMPSATLHSAQTHRVAMLCTPCRGG
jgi:hypothetical protein